MYSKYIGSLEILVLWEGFKPQNGSLSFFCHFLCQVEGSFESHVLPQERLLWIQLVLLNEPIRLRHGKRRESAEAVVDEHILLPVAGQLQVG